jgi:mannose-6-phosphate isomerase-like protein (cupin superfamily)
MTERTSFTTRQLPADYDVLAPDGSEIRVLGVTAHGSVAHGTLRPGGFSRAIRHCTVEEVWFILGGEGQLWRRQGEREEVTDLNAGMALTIPLGTHFQFRATGSEPLTFIMCTMPPWPGEKEAVRVEDFWPIVE